MRNPVGWCVMAVLLLGSCALAADLPAIKLMFGAATKETPRMTFLDFAYVTPEAKLEAGKPWGWTEAKKVTDWVFANDRLCSNPTDGLLDHCVTCWDGTFSLGEPKGKVAVHLWVGDAIEGIRRTRASYRVKAEGQLVVDERVTF
ncbi:MAG: hypothetical protein FJ278_15395, partial [Planctomycetes bacterium]|nr:hypothetical protein [Planctomycetota bacterium]